MIKEMFYCYKISNINNNKVYIGITNDYKKRWREHRCAAKSKDTYLYRAVRKYSFNTFYMEILETASTWNEICIIEENIIKSYNSTNPSKGYNLSAGGEGAYGIKRTPQQIARQKKDASKWAQDNLEYLRNMALIQMSDPKNREISRQGAYKQWELMSEKELVERKERLSQEAKDRWANDDKYKNKLLKKISKPIIANGKKYPSASAGARDYKISPNTMAARCHSNKEKWKNYCFC